MLAQLILPIIIFALFLSTYLFNLPDLFIHIALLLAITPIAIEAYSKLIAGIISTQFFLVVATIIGLIGHEEQAITVVLLIMLFAEFLEHLIEERTEGAIKSLIKLIPKDVLVGVNDREIYVPIDQVKPGMHVIVKTGSAIPVDGKIVEGFASINEASLTGESKLIDKAVGNAVYAGTFVQEGSIEILTEKIGSETFFGRIQKLIEQVDSNKAQIARLADIVASYLIPAILLFIAVVWVFTGNIRLVVTLLIFGSPLELTLITPLAVLSGMVAAFRQGILVKGGRALESMAYIDTIVFDKTGTITAGHPKIVKINVCNNNYTKNTAILIAAVAEKRSGHPIAKAILDKASQFKLNVPDAEQYFSVSGRGVAILFNAKKYYLGSRGFIESEIANGFALDTHVAAHLTDSYSCIYLASQEGLIAEFYVEDTIREDSKKTIDYFKQNNIETILLSGDKIGAVTHVADALGISKALGNMLPDEKLRYINSLNKNHKVAMVGDGINDAPALKTAYVGIAMGAMGMEPAIDAADVVLMTNDLFKITFIHKLSKKVFKIIKQNIFIGFALIHTIGIILAFYDLITPVQAALFHAIPDLLILANSARLINFK